MKRREIVALKNGESLMTEGSIWKHLAKFALPLALGYVFQQLYTTVDSVVVGNIVGKAALAAVGTTTPIINTLIGFFTGLATGAGVVIAKNFGAQNSEKVEKAVHTAVTLVFIFSVFATAIGIFMVPYMLRFMLTPDDVFAEASVYLKIYFSGVSSVMIYNMGSAILRAVGDSKRPLYYLVISSVINVVFDILFVGTFKMGVAGAAYATILSQTVSALLVLTSLTVSKGMYRLRWNKLAVSLPILKEILYIGLPTALQQSITSFSNVFVQSYINSFGTSVMAGWSAYLKLDQFVIIPMNSISMGVTTFAGQNLGAGKVDRFKKGTKTALIMAVAATVIVFSVMAIFAPQLVALFNKEAEVVEYGTYFIRLLTPFYVFCAVNIVISGTLCGAGETRFATVIKLFCFVVFRQVYLYSVSRITGSLFWVSMGYPFAWMLSAALISIYYMFKKKEISARFEI